MRVDQLPEMRFRALTEILPEPGSKKLANNTTLYRYESVERLPDSSPLPFFAVILHQTRLIMLDDDFNLYLRTGGWNTRTTLRRINQMCKFAMAGPAIMSHGEFITYRIGSGDVVRGDNQVIFAANYDGWAE